MVYIYTIHLQRDTIDYLIKAPEEPEYKQICRSEDQSLAQQVTPFSLAVCEHTLFLDASPMWGYITYTHVQSNESFTLQMFHI